MKLVTLNIWGGRLQDNLLLFLHNVKKDVDIFCFQEVFAGPTGFDQIDSDNNCDILHHLKTALPGYVCNFAPSWDQSFGLTMFLRNDTVAINARDNVIISKSTEVKDVAGHKQIPRNLQWTRCSIADTEYCIYNFHGLWNGDGKDDCPERIEQSKRIREIINQHQNHHTCQNKVLCGDFNLAIKTTSLQILEQGMINLVKKWGVTNTRTAYYTKKEKHADYILVSPSLDSQVKQFCVLPNVASDHAPLFLETS